MEPEESLKYIVASGSRLGPLVDDEHPIRRGAVNRCALLLDQSSSMRRIEGETRVLLERIHGLACEVGIEVYVELWGGAEDANTQIELGGFLRSYSAAVYRTMTYWLPGGLPALKRARANNVPVILVTDGQVNDSQYGRLTPGDARSDFIKTFAANLSPVTTLIVIGSREASMQEIAANTRAAVGLSPTPTSFAAALHFTTRSAEADEAFEVLTATLRSQMLTFVPRSIPAGMALVGPVLVNLQNTKKLTAAIRVQLLQTRAGAGAPGMVSEAVLELLTKTLIQTLNAVGSHAAKMFEERAGGLPWFKNMSSALKLLANDGKNAYKEYARQFQQFCENYPEFQAALRAAETRGRWARESEELMAARSLDITVGRSLTRAEVDKLLKNRVIFGLDLFDQYSFERAAGEFSPEGIVASVMLALRHFEVLIPRQKAVFILAGCMARGFIPDHKPAFEPALCALMESGDPIFKEFFGQEAAVDPLVFALQEPLSQLSKCCVRGGDDRTRERADRFRKVTMLREVLKRLDGAKFRVDHKAGRPPLETFIADLQKGKMVLVKLKTPPTDPTPDFPCWGVVFQLKQESAVFCYLEQPNLKPWEDTFCAKFDKMYDCVEEFLGCWRTEVSTAEIFKLKGRWSWPKVERVFSWIETRNPELHATIMHLHEKIHALWTAAGGLQHPRKPEDSVITMGADELERRAEAIFKLEGFCKPAPVVVEGGFDLFPVTEEHIWAAIDKHPTLQAPRWTAEKYKPGSKLNNDAIAWIADPAARPALEDAGAAAARPAAAVSERFQMGVEAADRIIQEWVAKRLEEQQKLCGVLKQPMECSVCLRADTMNEFADPCLRERIGDARHLLCRGCLIKLLGLGMDCPICRSRLAAIEPGQFRPGDAPGP